MLLTPEEEVDQFFDHITFKTRKVNMLYDVVYIKQFKDGFKLATDCIDRIPKDESFEDSQVYLSLEEALLDAHENNMLVKLL